MRNLERLPRRRQQRGFTLLEAIVAIVILASGSLALYGLFNTNLITLTRVQEVSREVPLVEQAAEYLSAMNLMQPTNGEFEVDGAQVTWSAKLLEPYRQSQSGRGFIGLYQLGLYTVEFTVTDRGRPLGTYSLRLVGYQQVREAG
jgi:general secretion pathway protein I